ncbi:MAG: flagellar biosynthetic protein FliR [Chlamydiales bacterium]|nr:flagellar biosynthetic protein FliR [Chlamydiales bacterium]
MADASYAELFIENPDFYVALFFLSLFRILPILVLTPFLGAKLLPAPARIGFAISLFFLLMPFIAARTTTPLIWSPLLIGYAIKEGMIGLLIGFLASIPFSIVQMSGIVTDNQRGSASMMGQDATTGTQASVIGLLYNSLLIVIFFWLDGPFLCFDALAKSYAVIAPDQLIKPDFFLNGQSAFWLGIVGMLGKLFALSCQLAAPALLTILMADVFLGIINRLAPQVQISFLGQGLKAYLADCALLLALYFILNQMGKMSISWIVGINDFILQLGT